ncbi:MAG: hypothetical protein U0T73_13970 [Chitinophagales bacterium]
MESEKLKQVVKARALAYFKSYLLIAALCLLLAHGPHGGWIFGFIAALFIGIMISATLWLLPFGYVMNMFTAAAVSLAVVFLSVAMIQSFPERFNSDILDVITIAGVLMTVVEIIRFVFVKKKGTTI